MVTTHMLHNFNSTHTKMQIHACECVCLCVCIYKVCHRLSYIHCILNTYKCHIQGRREGGGNWGILPWAPLCLWAPKDRYTLIEQSNTLLKQSLHIFCPGPLKLSLRPWSYTCMHICNYVGI